MLPDLTTPEGRRTVLAVGCIAVFFDSLDPRSYGQQTELEETRTKLEEKRLTRNRESFMKLLFYIAQEGYYRRGDKDTDIQCTDIWYLPIKTLMSFGTMLVVLRRRIQDELTEPKKYPYTIEAVRASVLRDFSAFAPPSLLDSFAKMIDEFGDGEQFLQDDEHAVLELVWHEKSVPKDERERHFKDSSFPMWIPGPPKDFSQLRPLPGSPSPYSKVKPSQSLRPEVGKGRSSQKRKAAPIAEPQRYSRRLRVSKY